MAQPVKFYYDLLSQQCRALYMFLEASKIPYEAIPVSMLKGEHLTENYKNKVNRLQSVPAIDDHGFKLTQPVAIIRHLVREKLVPEHWYPRHSLLRSRIDEFLEWQYNNMRLTSTDYFHTKWMQPALTRSQPDRTQVSVATERLEQCLNEFQDLWIRGDKFLVGSNISIADLLAICEIDQPKMIGFDPFYNRPRLQDWYTMVKHTMDHYYVDANQPVMEKFTHGGSNVMSMNA